MDKLPCMPEFIISKLGELKSMLGPDLLTFAAQYHKEIQQTRSPVTERDVRRLDDAVVHLLLNSFKKKGILESIPAEWKPWLEPSPPGTFRALPPRSGPESLPVVDVENHFEAHCKCCDAVGKEARRMRADTGEPPEGLSQEPTHDCS